jgi:hypothetical protein
MRMAIDGHQKRDRASAHCQFNYQKKGDNQMLSDLEIEKIMQEQAQEVNQRLGAQFEQSLEEKPSLKEHPDVKFAYYLKDKLRVHFGSAMSLTFWYRELQEICNRYSNLFESKAAQKRAIQLGGLIKLSGHFKGLDYAVDELEGCCNRDDIKELWADIAKWENKPPKK